MTIHIPRWALWLAGALAVAAAIAIAFALGRGSGDEDLGATPVAAGETSACGEEEAKKATFTTEVAGRIAAVQRVKAETEFGGQPPKGSPREILTGYGYEPGSVECADLNADGLEDMLTTYQAGVGRIAAWAILLADGSGGWELGFIRDLISGSPTIENGEVIERLPTYGRRDALCCPSGERVSRIVWSGQRFEVVDPESLPDDRLLKISGGRVQSLGKLDLWEDRPDDAKAFLGTPSMVTSSSGEACNYQWEDLGLTITFVNLGLLHACREGRAQSLKLLGAQAEAAGWHTDEGIGVGSDMPEIVQAYPDFETDEGVLALVSVPSPYADGLMPILNAYIARGKVMALTAFTGSAGE